MNLRSNLLALLAFAVLTLWVRERWALSAVETLAYLLTAVLLLNVVFRCQTLACGAPGLILTLIGCWGALQVAMHWSVVVSATGEALLYWAAAACLFVLGQNACLDGRERELFLRRALILGSIVGLVGIVQMFTSAGRVFWLFPSGYDALVVGPFVYWNNYAAFVELLLPVALALSFRASRHAGAWLLLAAALVASVVACGSRAGTILVVLEACAAFMLRPRRQNDADQRPGRAFLTFVVLAAMFILVVGYQYLWNRFSDDRDPYKLRRELLVSSISMIRAQPVRGFGFGSWPFVYPQYANIDVGLYANHAHNEWAQWGAEGGVLVPALMLVVFLWAARPAVQSVWGIGVLSVMIHSLVDYPFLRLGLAAWIFVFLGALAAYQRQNHPHAAAVRLQRLLTRFLAGAAVPVLLVGIFDAGKLAWADTLYRRATLQSLRDAVRLCPARSEYELALARVDAQNTVRHLQRAVALNPYATQARTALAFELEASGDTEASEQALLETARHDRQYGPAWSLANFYFRHNRAAEFWPWARAAANVYFGDLHPLFDLCFLVSENSAVVLNRVVVPRPAVERQFLSYLTEHGRLDEAHVIAVRIAGRADAADRDVLLAYVDASLAAGHSDPAREIWDSLCRKGLVSGAGDPILTNGDFSQTILNRGFDWRLPQVAGVVSKQTHEDGPSLSLSFSGNQPETCQLLTHFLALTQGMPYVLRFQYRTTDLPEHTGLYWSLGSGREYPLSSAEDWTAAEWHFLATAPQERISIDYRRYLGTTRIEGTLVLRRLEVEPATSPAGRPTGVLTSLDTGS